MNFLLLRSVFDPETQEKRLEQLKEEQLSDGFFNDAKRVSKVGREIKLCEYKISKVKSLQEKIENCQASIELLEEVDDDALFEELNSTLVVLEKEVESAKLETLLSGKYDNYNAIMTIHAGAGGTEAQDWAEMLFRMYSMYAEKHSYKIKVLDVLDGEDAGIKSISFLVSGEYAYGYLKAEKGVHRLVRISPFDANSRRHTSFASVEVMPEIEEAPDIVIRPEDLKIDTFRSSGAGGQHVNKTESAIRITHIPSGIIVACQTERSQVQNRETAMKMLYSKLVEKQELEEMEKLASIRGDVKKIEWGSQIRSYVFCPYTMVKDHRTNFETSDVQAVMNGEIQDFINEYLKRTSVKA